MSNVISTQDLKKRVWNFYQALDDASNTERASVIRHYVDTNVTWHGPHPINHLTGAEALISGFWHPLALSFPNLHRETHILMAGQFAGKDWVSAIGYLSGTFIGDWLGISATGRDTHIRFGEFLALNNNGKIAESYTLLDILDVLRQAGIRPLPPDRGETGLVPPPLAGDGVMLEPQPDHEGAQSIDLAMKMGKALGAERALIWTA